MASQCLKLSHCMTLVASTMCAWCILRLLGQAEEQTHAKEPATGRGTRWHSAPPVPSQGLSAAPRLPRSPSATRQPPSAFVFSDFFLLPSGRGEKKKKKKPKEGVLAGHSRGRWNEGQALGKDMNGSDEGEAKSRPWIWGGGSSHAAIRPGRWRGPGLLSSPQLSETPFYVLIGQAAGCLCTETYKP